MKQALVLLLMSMAGCAANSGVVPMGGDIYFASRQAATGFSGASALKGEVLQEANQHCLAMRKTFEVVNLTEAQQTFIFGNYPKAEVQFRCVNK